jgi:hypothetical protein
VRPNLHVRHLHRRNQYLLVDSMSPVPNATLNIIPAING